MDNIHINAYLKIYKQNRGRNKLYLSQVVDNIKKVKNKNSLPNVTKKKPSSKKKATSLKPTSKPISKKKESSPKSSTEPRKVLSQKKNVPKEQEKIKCLDQLYILYEPETNRQYCKKGMDLEGVNCSKSHTKFGMLTQPPSNMQLIWICYNRRSSNCTHALCSNFYFHMCNDMHVNGYEKSQTRR